MTLSAVVVNYHASTDIGRLAANLRREAQGLGLELQLIVVDHSQDPTEAEHLRACNPQRLIVEENRGFAFGVNRGIREAEGSWILVANPDVELLPGALGQLFRYTDRHPILGPKFVLGHLLYPLADRHFFKDEFLRLLAVWWPGLGRHFVVDETARSLSAWKSPEPIACPFLSGALMLFSRQAYAQVGPWDERFFLYFEESDWLLRAYRLGLTAAYVPAAVVNHAWGKSALPERCLGWMAKSRRLFLAKHFTFAGKLMSRIPFPSPKFPLAVVPPSLGREEEVLWLVSPTPLGVPSFGLFAGSEFPEGKVRESLAFDRHPRTFKVHAFVPAKKQLLGPWRWDG